MRAPEDPIGSESNRDPTDAPAAASADAGGAGRAMSPDARSVLDRWRDGLQASTGRLGGAERAREWLLRLDPLALVRPGVVVVALAVVAVGAGAILFALRPSDDDRGPAERESRPTVVATSPAPTRGERATGTTHATEVVVHAAGAVAHPGLYRLTAGSRVSDLIEAAGGLATDADGDRVNLAAPLTDGGRLYVPRRNETTAPTVVAADAGAPAGPTHPDAGKQPSGPVNINTAGPAELDSLPGVGPATSAAIIDYRNQHGPFRSVDDLGKVRGIGTAKLDQLRPLVTT